MNIRFVVQNVVNVMFRRELSFQFDRIPLVARNISNRKRNNLFRIGLNRMLPIAKTLGRPYMAHISPSGVCDLGCKICPTKDPTMEGRSLLSFDTFRKFVDEAGDTLLYLILWSWGEPLLNPDFSKMARYAKDNNILTVTSTNLNQLNPRQAEELVQSGLDALIIAVDGMTQESYARYRVGGNLERVLNNIRMLVDARRTAGLKEPILNLRMVVSKENEDQMDAFESLGRELGVDMVSFKAFSTRQSGKEDEAVNRQFVPRTGSFRWYRYEKEGTMDRKVPKYWCRFPWTKPTMFADGMIISCEFDKYYQAPFGNINEQSFDEIWFSPEAEEFRRKFQKNRDHFPFCDDCVYDYKLFDGCVFDMRDLREG